MKTQEQIESIIYNSQKVIEFHKDIIKNIEDKIRHFESELLELNDPHALIPKRYEDIEDWLLKVPCPDLVRKSHTFKNKSLARRAQYVSNTFQIDYYIIRIKVHN